MALLVSQQQYKVYEKSRNIFMFYFDLKILCITPIKHLEGLFEYIKKFGDVDYFPDLNLNDFSSCMYYESLKIYIENSKKCLNKLQKPELLYKMH